MPIVFKNSGYLDVIQFFNSIWLIINLNNFFLLTIKPSISVRLSSSLNTRTHGIVEILLHNTWYALCGTGFNDISARVVCKEIGGFTNGTKLPAGAFGKYYGQTAMHELFCKGNETTVMNCSFDPLRSCSNQHYGYASVSCYNGSTAEGRLKC